eukprot:CAMPEP_0172302104 /NCGR_PEP_ID=MMETSP1058-20130122/3859_1 /TAXON_ID=83371 /ORGANISM="Detonula confervacea, Strain CCMP 353" /LENGTH=552 /DNA_ID=CAMNT_0013012461 /DNA_START=38 /DNA_END=1696 /DNA_ORIENTATION=-
MSDKAEPKAIGDEEKRLKRKQSLEASVTLGLGYGKKKKQHVEAFYSAVWPVLQGAGWSLAKGEGDEIGATYFMPPGVTMGNKGEDQDDVPQTTSAKDNPATRKEGPWDCATCGHTNVSAKSRCTGVVGDTKCMAWRGGKRVRKPYFSKVRDVIERVLEKKNEVEAMAADSYIEIIPDANYTFIREQKDKKSEPSPSLQIRQNINHFAWKDERTHYEKSSSRVGPMFQVDVLPAAGSYTATNNNTDVDDGGAMYERVWDPTKAAESGKLDFVHTRVKFNQKESAYNMFYSRDYHLPGFYEEVSSVSPTDCSDWTKEDKDRFRAAVFEHHENMKEVSKMIGKPISECITYYLVKFKRSKSYKSLKRSMKRKANPAEGSAGTLVCNECGKGGMLIACDTCEAHYHLACAAPPLESIPDGTWVCGNCKRETRSMLSSQDEMSCGMDQQPTERLVDTSMETPGDAESKGPGDFCKDKLDLEETIVEGSGDNHNLNLGSEYIAAEGSGDDHKRKFDSEAGVSMLEETASTSEQSNDSSSHKRMRVDESNMATIISVPV